MKIDSIAIRKVELFFMRTTKDQVANFKNLYEAGKICGKGVRWKRSVITYNENLLSNTLKLKDELEKETYKPGKLIPLEVFEPRRRTVLSSRYRDRQAQRALIKHYLYEEVTKRFIYDNHAGQSGKGTATARKRVKIMLEKAYRLWGADYYIHTFDIRSFFQSTRHDVAKEAIRKNVTDKWVIKLIYQFIDNFENGIGLGSEIGQLTELIVLNELDHVIKERLKTKFYIRYMDDFIIIHRDKEYLKYCREVITDELDNIGLALNTKKSRIIPIRKKFGWLGFEYHQTATGKIVITLPKKKVIRERRKLKRLIRAAKAGKITKEAVDNSFRCWQAHAGYGNNHNTVRHMQRYYKNLWRNEHD